jgi:hypothetical protein
VRERYADFVPTLAAEKLAAQHSCTISRETLRSWMIADGLWTDRVGRPIRVKLHGKNREHGPDSGDSGLTRGGYVLSTAQGGGLLRAIMACKLECTQDWLLRRRIARSKPGC